MIEDENRGAVGLEILFSGAPNFDARLRRPLQDARGAREKGGEGDRTQLEACGGHRELGEVRRPLRPLRDSLQFEFFFVEKEDFRAELAGWTCVMGLGGEEIYGIVWRIRPLLAHRILRSFHKAYRVVVDALVRRLVEEGFDERAFLASPTARGKQHVLHERIRNPESISGGRRAGLTFG